MTSPSMVGAAFVSKELFIVHIQTAWTPQSDLQELIYLLFPAFQAKKIFYLTKQSFSSPLCTLCKLLDMRLAGDQKPIEGEFAKFAEWL